MDFSQPWNIWPMDVEENIRKGFWKEITSPLIYEPSTKTFHPDGLYSETIFGQVGSPARMGTMAYINLNCQIFSPIIYLNLIKVASWYQDLMESRAWAIWDNKLKDFVACDKDAPGAQTGFAYFLSHVKDIDFPLNSSPSRTNRIGTIRKAIETNTYIGKQCPVCPAGWRDVKIDNGREKVDDVNKLYTSLLIMSKEVKDVVTTPELVPFFDTAKYHIQLKVVEIFNYWKNFWEGKTGFGQSRYNKRGLALGTRNVITVSSADAESPKDPKYLKHNETQTPLFVAAKMFEPKTVHALNLLFYQPIYTLGSIQVPAINPDTLEIEYIEISPADVTYALSSDSKRDFINAFEDASIRQDPVTIKSVDDKEYYLWMIYDLEDKIYLFRNLSDLEALLNRDKDNSELSDIGVKAPITLSEISPLTEDELRSLSYDVIDKFHRELNLDIRYLDEIQIKLSAIPKNIDGTDSDQDPITYGGCWVNEGPELGTVYINPNIARAIEYYTKLSTLPSIDDFKLRVLEIIAHEIAHGLWNTAAQKYKDEILEDAKKEKFTTPYLDTIKPTITSKEKYEQELFCEYVAYAAIYPPKEHIQIDKSKCRPITKVEMLYIAVNSIKDKPCTMTRYPAVEMGSIYPSLVVVATTIPSRTVEMVSQWDSRVSITFSHYPIIGVNTYAEGTTIHYSKTPNLDAIKLAA